MEEPELVAKGGACTVAGFGIDVVTLFDDSLRLSPGLLWDLACLAAHPRF